METPLQQTGPNDSPNPDEPEPNRILPGKFLHKKQGIHWLGPKKQLCLSPQVVFIILGAVFGLALLVITPPFQAPDEVHHYYRAYHVSEGKIVGTLDNGSGDYLPVGVQEVAQLYFNPRENLEQKADIRAILAAFRKPFNAQPRVATCFSNTLLTSPVAYLPQALGIAAGRLFHAPGVASFYLGRLFNLAAWLALIYLAIRKTPVHKWVFLAVALMPMTISLAVTLSPDVLTQALAYLLIANFLSLAFEPHTVINRKSLLLLLALSVILALCKHAYILIIGLFLLIPIKKFGSWKKYILAGLLIVTCALVVWSLWAWQVKDIPFTKPEMQPDVKLRMLISNPLDFLKSVWETDRAYWGIYARSFFGVLGWMQVYLPEYVYPVFAFFLLFVALIDKGPAEIRFSFANRAVIALVVMGTFTLLDLIRYVYLSPVGGYLMEGTQGRYYLPIAPLLFLLLYNQTVFSKEKLLIPLTVMIGSPLALLAAIRALLIRYYV